MKNMFLNAAVAVCCVALALAPVRAEPSRSEPKRLSCLSGTNLIVNGTFESGEFSPWTRNATKGNAAYVNLFVESEATLRLASGEVKLAQKTAYPWKGGVRIEVTPGRARR